MFLSLLSFLLQISPSSPRHHHNHHHHHQHHNTITNTDNNDEALSVASSRSSTSRFVNEVVTGVAQTHGLGRRRPLLEKRLRRMEQDSTHHFVPEDISSSTLFLSSSSNHNASIEITAGGNVGVVNNAGAAHSAGGGGSHEVNDIIKHTTKFDTAFDDDDDDAHVAFGGNACQGFGGDNHGGGDDEYDAAAAAAAARRDGLLKARLASKNNVRYKPPRHLKASSSKYGGCGARALRAWDALLQVVEWDYENKRIAKLACPYIVQALVGGIAEATRVAVVGRFYGTRELSAYVIVDALIGLCMGVVSGIYGAAGVLCCQSIGTGQTKLTGQYVQLSVFLFTVCIIPFSLGWTFAIGPTLHFMGFDERTVDIGVDFTKVYVWAKAWQGIGEGILMFLDITDHEIFGTVFAICNEVSVTIMMLLLSILSKETATLLDMSYFMVGIRFLNVVLVVLIIWCKRWWRKYYPGMIFSCALLVRTQQLRR
jgi:MatE